MRHFALQLARSRLGGVVIRFAFAYFSFLLPVHRVYQDKELIAFHHPAPAYPVHLLIVPRQGIGRLAQLPDGELERVARLAFRAARSIAASHGLESFRIVLNAGSFQDVAQVHFHLICEEQHLNTLD